MLWATRTPAKALTGGSQCCSALTSQFLQEAMCGWLNIVFPLHIPAERIYIQLIFPSSLCRPSPHHHATHPNTLPPHPFPLRCGAGVMIVANLRRGVYYQKCHDPACRLAQYSSPGGSSPFSHVSANLHPTIPPISPLPFFPMTLRHPYIRVDTLPATHACMLEPCRNS